MTPEHHLPINLDTFGFVERETVDGEPNSPQLKNQCGRDFLYYALHYYHPDKFNPQVCPPAYIRKQGIFGVPNVPQWLLWSGISFTKVPKLLLSLGLRLEINGKDIRGYYDFLNALAPFRPMRYATAMKQIEDAVDGGAIAGVDIGLGLGGLIDHVMFVYGYDAENLYVFDTHQVEGLQYEKVTEAGDTRFVMKLPRAEVKKRWGLAGRVWVVSKLS